MCLTRLTQESIEPPLHPVLLEMSLIKLHIWWFPSHYIYSFRIPPSRSFEQRFFNYSFSFFGGHRDCNGLFYLRNGKIRRDAIWGGEVNHDWYINIVVTRLEELSDIRDTTESWGRLAASVKQSLSVGVQNLWRCDKGTIGNRLNRIKVPVFLGKLKRLLVTD